MEQRVTFHKMLPKTQSLHSRNTSNRSSMAPPQTNMAEPSRAHPPLVVVFSSSVFIFGLFYFSMYGWKGSTFVWLVMGLRIWYFVWGFEKWRFLFWAWIFFFSKLIICGFWVGQKNGFWFGFIRCDLYVCESKHVCTVFLKREREREIWGPFDHRVKKLLFKNMWKL